MFEGFRAPHSPRRNLTIEQRQEIIRLLVREVFIGGDDVTIRHSIPNPNRHPTTKFFTTLEQSRRARSRRSTAPSRAYR
jgi:hypothetical protein